MKIKSIKRTTEQSEYIEFGVSDGYVKTMHGSLADVDCDFPSDRRPDVKKYMEERYNHDGKRRVFSAGTFITMKIRSAIKDYCRAYRVPVGTTNMITAMIDDNATWTDMMKMAVNKQQLRDFINKHYEVFDELLPIMEQPRSAGIHASAVVVTPDHVKGEDVECFDVIPMRKMDGELVSELTGTELDEMGFLKNDVLAIAELSRLGNMFDICKKIYSVDLNIHKIISNYLDEERVYEIIRDGYTQGIFQLSSEGMTRLVKQMKLSCIDDMIAAVALYRPATLNSGAAQTYCDVKNELVEPVYLWGTYDILKDTYGVAVYQEQLVLLAQKIGGLGLGDGVNLVKAVSKKKIDKIRKFKDKFFSGAEKNLCP